MKFKKIIFISLLMIVISMASVSASEDISLSDNDSITDNANQNDSITDNASQNDSITDNANQNDSITDNASQNENTSTDEDQNDIADSMHVYEINGSTFDDIQIYSNLDDGDLVKINGRYTSNGNSIYTSKDITIEGHDAILDGEGLSGIIWSDKSITLKNIKFINSNDEWTLYIRGNATLINCTFENNSGAVIKTINNEKSDSVKIMDSIFNNNRQIIDSNCTDLTIENTVFDSNNVTSFDKPLFDIKDSKAFPSKMVVKSSTFSNNYAEPYFGIYVNLMNNASEATLDNCIFNKNIGGESAMNPAFIYLNGGNLTVSKSNFTGNTRIFSGEIYSEKRNYNLLIMNSSFKNTKGWVLKNEDSLSTEIYDCIFEDNNGLIDSYGNLSIYNSNFRNNKDSIRFWAYGSSSTIDNCNFTNSSDGMTAIYICYPNVIIKNSNFNSNLETAVIAADKFTVIKGNSTTTYKGNICLNNSLKKFTPFKASMSKLTTTYKSGKTFNVKISSITSKKPISGVKFYLYVYSGKKLVSSYISAKTNSSGIASFDVSSIPVGTYKVFVGEAKYKSYYVPYKSSNSVTVTVNKAKTIVKAPKFTAKTKKSKYFKVTVKNKITAKAVSNIKIKIKVYTGKKYKTYTLSTNSKGIAKLNSKKLKKGSHKVVISSGNKNYSISKTSTIVIK